MRCDALDFIDLYCTACRTYEGQVIQYALSLVPGEVSGDFILSGWLVCSHCGKSYPVIDGVPVLFQGMPGQSEAEHTALYLDAHYGPLNANYWEKMRRHAGRGLSLDIGCSVGRYTFECAKSGFAVGIDVNFDQLKLAAGFQRTGKIKYTRKTRGYGSEDIVSSFTTSPNALFLLADVHDPPFKMDTFDFISGLNLVDSVKHPLTALGQMDAMLKTRGRLLLSAPFTWSEDINVAERLETDKIDPHAFVLQLLAGKQVPECGFDYRIITEKTGIPWVLRKQDTQMFRYIVDAVLAEKR